MSTEKVTIVCSRFRRNVDDFLSRMHTEVAPVNIIIYDKCCTEKCYKQNGLWTYSTIPFNKGNEASVYLKYIVDHYDQLSEYTFFIQDEEFAWHHSGSIIDKFREALDSNKKYYNINDLAHWDKPNLIPPHLYQILLQWYAEYVEEYIPLSKVPNTDDLIYGHRGAAQFLVHQDLIHGLPKVFYERLYNWIITTELPNYVSGRLLEWTWHVFWVILPDIC